MKYVTNKISETEIRQIVWSAQKHHNQKSYNFLYEFMSSWMEATSWKISKQFPIVPVTFVEIQSYKNISFFISVMQFDFALSIPFPQFVIQRLKWFLYSKMRTFVTKNHQVLNYSSDYEDETTICHRRSFHKLGMTKNHDFDYYKKNLNTQEQKILQWKLEKYRTQEIAKMLKVTKKQVDKEWHKIKEKLRHVYIFS